MKFSLIALIFFHLSIAMAKGESITPIKTSSKAVKEELSCYARNVEACSSIAEKLTKKMKKELSLTPDEERVFDFMTIDNCLEKIQNLKCLN
jgi:hypothetical protein